MPRRQKYWPQGNLRSVATGRRHAAGSAQGDGENRLRFSCTKCPRTDTSPDWNDPGSHKIYKETYAMTISKYLLQAIIVAIGSLLAFIAIMLLKGPDHVGDE